MNVIGKATLNWEKYTEYVQRETINVKEHPEDSWYLDIRYKVPHEVESIVWSCMRSTVSYFYESLLGSYVL